MFDIPFTEDAQTKGRCKTSILVWPLSFLSFQIHVFSFWTFPFKDAFVLCNSGLHDYVSVYSALKGDLYARKKNAKLTKKKTRCFLFI